MLPHGRIWPYWSPWKERPLACKSIISFQGFVFYTLKGFFYYGYASPERIRLCH